MNASEAALLDWAPAFVLVLARVGGSMVLLPGVGETVPRSVPANPYGTRHGFGTVGHTSIVAGHKVGGLIDTVGESHGTAPERVSGAVLRHF